jgi:UDP-MurNAc hydroxylase
VNLAEELRTWWEPLLANADVLCAGVNGRMAIDFEDAPEDAPDDALVVDFQERTVRPWRRDRDDDVAHHFTFPRALVVDSVLGRREDWNTDLLLSFRFQERSKGPFNKYLFAFLSALSQERIAYVEDFYRREAHCLEGGQGSFFQMNLDGRPHVVQRLCPHGAGAGSLDKFLVYDGETDILTCTLHGWQWRRDGTCLTADGHPLYVRPANVALQCSDCTYRLRAPAWAEPDRPATEHAGAEGSASGG